MSMLRLILPGLSAILIMSAVAAAAGRTEPVLREAFDAKDGALPAGWRAISGDWRVSGGALTVDADEAFITVGDVAWRNYEIEVTATFLKVKNDSRWLSIVFRAPRDGAKPWSQFPIRFNTTARNGAEFAVRTNAGWSVRRTGKAKAASELGKPRKLRVVVSGTNVRGYVDGELVIESAFCVERSAGCVGLAVSGCSARFDDFSVRLLPDTAPPPDRDVSRCEVVGHRGWSAVYPENTLIAATSAAHAGADGSECDVYATKDGAIVLMHDGKVDRTTNGEGEVTKLTLGQLSKLDAGSWKDKRFAGERVPTLEEYLAALKGSGCIPVIEIKMKGISRQVVDAVRKADMIGTSAIIAFDGEVVKEVRELEPRIRCAWLCGKNLTGSPAERADWIASQARTWKTDIVDLSYNMLSREVLDELSKRKIKVWTWTVNDPLVMEALMRWGVESITTDKVDVLVKLKRDLTKK